MEENKVMTPLLVAVTLVVLGLVGYGIWFYKIKPLREETTQGQGTGDQGGIIGDKKPTAGNTTTTPTTTETDPTKVAYAKVVKFTLPEDCLKITPQPSEKKTTVAVTCANLGEASLSATEKVVLMPKDTNKVLVDRDKSFDVYLVFYKDGKKLDIEPYYFGTQVDLNPSWFSMEVRYMSPSNILVTTTTFESFPSHYYYDGKFWNRFSPWDQVKNVFPDKTEPPFTVEVSDKFIKVIEQNYCCDTLYDTSKKDRVNYRQVYYLDRATLKVLKTEQVPRLDKQSEENALG